MSVTDKLERLSSPSEHSTRSSSSSTRSYDGDFRDSFSTTSFTQSRVDSRRLGQIEAVRAEHSIRKHGHRYYVLHVYRKSARVPIHHRDPDYGIETPYAAFSRLREKILSLTARNEEHCSFCRRRATIIREHKRHVHDLNRVLQSTKEKEEAVERLFHGMLRLAGDAHESETCNCCESASHLLTVFLSRQYQPTTGII
jgi:hypothetical protein